MANAKDARKVESLLSALGQGVVVVVGVGGGGYLRSWRHWVAFCKGKGVTAWLGSKDDGWGDVSMNFTLSDFTKVGDRWEFLSQ